MFVYFSPGFPNAKMTFIDLVYHLVKMTYNKHMAKRDDDLEFSINAPFDDGRAVIDKVPLYLVNGCCIGDRYCQAAVVSCEPLSKPLLVMFAP